MAWPTSGRVNDVAFSRVFGSLVTGKLTGTLRLVQDGRSYTVNWNEGVIGDADSSMPEDTMGRVALDAGLLEAGVADRLLLYVAPLAIGGPGAPAWLGGAGVKKLARAPRFRFDGAPRLVGEDVVLEAIPVL